MIDVASGKARIPAPIDRCFTKPRWSADGSSVFALVEQSLVTHVARIDLASGKLTELTHGDRFDVDLDVAAKGRIVVLGGDDLHPYAPRRGRSGRLRALGDHNAWLARQAPGEDRSDPLQQRRRHRDRRPAGQAGRLPCPAQRYPTIVRLHGGPVYQFSHEFMADWQVYAANGFAVARGEPARQLRARLRFRPRDLCRLGQQGRAGCARRRRPCGRSSVSPTPTRLGVGGWSYGAILTNAVIASDHALQGRDQRRRRIEHVRACTATTSTSANTRSSSASPWANRDAYDRASFPFLHADRISTPTLFQCAEKDFNVPCLGAEQMYQALRARDVPTQLVIYPGEHHGLSVPSYLRDRMQRNLAWYQPLPQAMNAAIG